MGHAKIWKQKNESLSLVIRYLLFNRSRISNNKEAAHSMEYSVSPDGERFNLPTEEDSRKEYDRLKELVERRREEGFEIVVVMGLGFVGAVMAGVVADSVD